LVKSRGNAAVPDCSHRATGITQMNETRDGRRSAAAAQRNEERER
jgi:hypothetical protein